MDKDIGQKLRYKSGTAAVLYPPEGFQLGVETIEAPQPGECEFLLLFVGDLKEAEERAPEAISLLQGDAVFWIAYPKGSSKVKTDVNRDTLAALLMERTIFRPVSNVAIDSIWSALRFRQKDLVKPRK